MSSSTDSVWSAPNSPVYRSRGKTALIRGSIAAAVLTVAAIGALIGAYYLSPVAHTWMNTHIFTPLTSQHITAGQALYMIAAPVGCVMTLLGIGLYSLANRRKTGSIFPKMSCSGALKVAGVVTLAVLLGVGAYLAYHFCPQIQTAVHHGMSQKWTIGQSILHVGLPAAAAGALIICGVALNRHLSKTRYAAV